MMPCYSPLTAWEGKEINESGKRSMVFKSSSALDPNKPKELPCGQCIGCRLGRSKEWAMRCMHEISLYEKNCFITLTIDDEHLMKRNNPRSLDVTEFQKFMKRLRKKLTPKNPYSKTAEPEEWKEYHDRTAIRFFHCGEYGDKYGRPHYHAILFNLEFDDLELWRIDRGNRLYISKTLQSLWTYGFSTIGEANFESAAYVARYILKKVNGKNALEHYNEINWETGEVKESRAPEYITMSRNGGIGKGWYDKYKNDLYPKDFITIKGKKMKPAKYYDRMFELEYPSDMEKIKMRRQELIKQRNLFSDDLSLKRLRIRERVQEIKAEKLKRSHDQ
jgi:hypothetical protein